MNEQKLIDALVEVENTILKKWRKEKPGILVGSNGGLIQLYGGATFDDYLEWHDTYFK